MKRIILIGTILCLSLTALVGCDGDIREAFGHTADTDGVFVVSDFYQSFIGYVEEIKFDGGSVSSGYLQLRGDAYESEITTHIRVRFEEGLTRSAVALSDLEIGQQVIVYHTLKGDAVWIALPLNWVSLPFYGGSFIFTPSYFDEYRDIVFRFGEGQRNYGEFDGVYYVADNFLLHVWDFICTMISISPVLVGEITTDISSSDIPFEGITDDNYLYSLQISDYFFRMRVHRAEDYGYLYFVTWEWEILATFEEHGYDHRIWRDDLLYHSLYKITLGELEKIIEFAERLEKRKQFWTAPPVPENGVR